MSTVDDPFGQHSPNTPAAAPVSAGVPADDDFADEFDDAFDEEDGDDRDDGGNVSRGRRAAAVVEYVATSFADNPDAVDVVARERANGDVMILLHADRGDAGRLIGRRGRVINAIRQVARAAGSIDGERVQVDLAEE